MRLVILMLILALMMLPTTFASTSDKILVSPARLTPVPKSFAPDFYDRHIDNFDLFQRKYPVSTQPIGTLDGYSLFDHMDTPFFNTIFLADATGAPKYKFGELENIYLKDARIPITREEFSPSHSRINYRNMYKPNDPVDVYIMLDFAFYSDELPKFRFLKSSDVESRTRGQFILKKLTVYTDDEGRIPFTNLGSMAEIIDLDVITSPGRNREGLQESALLGNSAGQSGKGGTYDYANAKGNILADSPYLNTFSFDLFIDAEQNGRYSSYGDHYYHPGDGLRKEDKDYYITPEVPGFQVIREAPLRTGCCVCDTSKTTLLGINDIYECKEYCTALGQETSRWKAGSCPTDIVVPAKKEEVKINTFIKMEYPETTAEYYLVPFSQSNLPSKSIGIAYKLVGKPQPRLLARKDGKLLNIDADYINFKEDRMELLLATKEGEVYVFKITQLKDMFYAEQLQYVNRIWDPIILDTKASPFQGEITSAFIRDDGNVLVKDSNLKKYTLIFDELRFDAPTTPQQVINFEIKEFDHNYEEVLKDEASASRFKRIAYESQNGKFKPLKRIDGNYFDFTPSMIDYDPSRNLLVALSNVKFIYVIKPVQRSDGEIAGDIMQIVERVQDKDVVLVGEGTFIGQPNEIRLTESGDLAVIDEEGHRFVIELESESSYQEISDKLLVEGDWQAPEISIEEVPEIIEEEIITTEVSEKQGLDQTTMIIVSALLILLVFAFAALIIKRQRE